MSNPPLPSHLAERIILHALRPTQFDMGQSQPRRSRRGSDQEWLYDRLCLVRRERQWLTKRHDDRFSELPDWTWDRHMAPRTLQKHVDGRAEDEAAIPEAWAQQLSFLRDWAAQRGGINLVRSLNVDENGRAVGQWMTYQRNKRAFLSRGQCEALQQLPGWEWGGQEARRERLWQESAERLFEYVGERKRTRFRPPTC